MSNYQYALHKNAYPFGSVSFSPPTTMTPVFSLFVMCFISTMMCTTIIIWV